MTIESNPTLALGTFSIGGSSPFGALVVDDWAVGLEALGSHGEIRGVDLKGRDVLGVLDTWQDSLPRLLKAATIVRQHAAALAEKRLITQVGKLSRHAPFMPRNLFCTGANYRGHIEGLLRGDPSMCPPGTTANAAEIPAMIEAELTRRGVHGRPYCFIKLTSSVSGPDDVLVLPRDVEKPDWELELAVVIGCPCRRVSASQAMDCVAGYAVINDVTARDMVFRNDGVYIGADWLAAKSQPGFAPFGPYLVPASQVTDVYKLKMQLSVNDHVMQDECTSDMLINIARQIEHISSLVHLMPGDVIATGSPAGNGSMHGVFLKPGDVMVGTIEGLGTQRIRCVAEADGSAQPQE